MDKRTILAFVLIGVIIFAMPYYFRLVGEAPPAPDPIDLTETTQAPARSSEPANLDAAESPAEPRAPQPDGSDAAETPSSSRPAGRVDFEARDVVIDTDLFTAVFSTRGGVLTSIHLKDYHDESGRDLELMGDHAIGLGLSVAGRSLKDAEFVPNLDRIDLTGDNQATLVLRTTLDGNPIEKRILFQGNRYRMELSVQASGLPTAARIGLVWDGSLADTEGGGGTEGGLYGMAYDYVVTMAGGEVEDWTVDRLEDDDPIPSGRISWLVVRSKYFLAGIIPSQELLYDLDLAGSNVPKTTYRAEILAQYSGEPLNFGVYLGPLDYTALKRQNTDLYGREEAVELTELVQFGWNFVRPILRPVTILIIHAFSALHNVIPNYGFVIIVFSILVKVTLFPLTRKSMESMAKMQELQPQISALREKHGSDQQKLNQEMMKLYRDQKVNPVGGCLPMLLQAPILFSLFNVFRNAIQLRQAGFGLWITDLSKPDVLPIAGFDLHVLPLLMSAAMFVQQKMTMKDPKQAAMVYIMPVFMIWIFWSMSSGLVLYFTMYNLLSLFEQQVLKRAKAAAEA